MCDQNSHSRIIQQQIELRLEPKLLHASGKWPNITVLCDDHAEVSCFICEASIDIRTRYLSNSNRQWMVGKYMKHVESHSPSKEPELENETNSDEEGFEDELDKFLLRSSNCSETTSKISRSQKRNIKMTTEAARDTKQRKLSDFFSLSRESTTKPIPLANALPTDPTTSKSIQKSFSKADSALLLRVIEKLPLTKMVKLLIREAVSNNFKNMSKDRKDCKGIRYELETKNVGAYLYLLGGRKDYEELVVNLGMPSLSTIQRHINQSCDKIEEGVLRVRQLQEFLKSRDLPNYVFISEDGTKILSRIRYDINTDQIVGLCPQLNQNGMPNTRSFPATSPEVIHDHLNNNKKSSIAYVILATPLACKTLSFNLLCFGTDNTFSIDEVLLRWAVMEQEMAKVGIIIVGYGADGDSRLIGGMKVRMGMPRDMSSLPTELPSGWKPWFAAKGKTSTVFVQDTTHIVNKMKNSLLSTTRALQIGKFPASRGHLITVAKDGVDNTGLLEADLDDSDKMCVNLFHKLIDPRVTDWLKKYPGTNGTRAYIEVMKAAYESYEHPSLSYFERTKEIWFAAFFVRVWHRWVEDSDDLKIDEHFMTDNAELGIELNAHSMINFLLFCRDQNAPELFLPTLLNSQHNERSFANARSMTGAHNTVINFDMLEYTYKATRSEYLDELRMKLKEKISFSRGNFKEVPFTSFEFPSDLDIENAVLEGMEKAKRWLTAVQIEWDEADFTCVLSASTRNEILPLAEVDLADQISSQAWDESEDIEEDVIYEARSLLTSIGSDLSKISKQIQTESDAQRTPKGFFKIVTSSGDLMLARKVTVLWMLSNDRTKISNDRLLRYRTTHKGQRGGQATVALVSKNEALPTLSIGEWFIYKDNSKLIIAQALGFMYLTGKLKREKECSLKSIPVEPPAHLSDPKGIGVICSKFYVSKKGNLRVVSDSSKINIDRYASHIEKPLLETFQLTESCLQYLNTF